MAQELIYTSCGYYLIPDIRLSYTSDKPLGKYGRMHRAYLEQNNPMLLDDLILTETLFPHLWKIDEIAHCRMERLTEELFPDQVKLRVRFSLDNLKLDDDVLNIPLFMADQADRLIGLALEKKNSLGQ